MKSAAMTTTLVLVMLVSLATLFVAGKACDKVQTRSRSEICHFQFAGVPEKYEVCKKALEKAPDTAQVTVFALMATRMAKLRFDTNAEKLERLAGNMSLPADDRAKYRHCVGHYAVARKHMEGVIKDLDGCKFEHIKQAYHDTDNALYKCQTALPELPIMGYPPLVQMARADRDANDVACGLFDFAI